MKQILIVLIFFTLLFSGCVTPATETGPVNVTETVYTHSAPGNHTEKIIIFSDGVWIGVFYNDFRSPEASYSGLYKENSEEYKLISTTGGVLFARKNGTNLDADGKLWIKK